MNTYSILADIVVAIHLSYMGYLVFGELLILIGWPLGWQWIRNPWFRCSHLAMILIVVFEAIISFDCPLSTLEDDLREKAGQKWSYEEKEYQDMSFTGRMLRGIQFAGLHHWAEHINTTFYVAGAIILATTILVPPRFRKRPVTAAPPQPLAAEPATVSSAVTAIAPVNEPPKQ